MRRGLVLVVALAALAACAPKPDAQPTAGKSGVVKDPHVGIFRSKGGTVTPNASVGVGTMRVGVNARGGASLGTSLGGLGLGVGL